MKYQKRLSIKDAVVDCASKATYYAGSPFDTNNGEAYFNQFVKQMAKFIANNYRRRRKSVAVVLACLLMCWQAWAGVTVNMDAIKQIESSGNAYAHNKRTDARGLYQITPVCREDYNAYHPGKVYADDLWDAEINRKVAEWYFNKRIPQLLKHYKIDDTIENRLIAYHDGIGNLKRYIEGKRTLGKEMLGYLEKYRGLTNG